LSVSLRAELAQLDPNENHGARKQRENGKIQTGNNDVLDMAELSRAVMTTDDEPTVVDFAPPNNPQRIQRVAELTGASIRRTCADAGPAAIELVDQAEAVVRQLREDANAFVESLDGIGNANAARIERALSHLRGLVETVGAERRRILSLADPHQRADDEPSQTLALSSRRAPGIKGPTWARGTAGAIIYLSAVYCVLTDI
jgi:hypothetical protein